MCGEGNSNSNSNSKEIGYLMKRSVFPWALVLGAVCAAVLVDGGAAGAEGALAQPHFASLKADEVHMRKGPGDSYGILWTYRSIGLPVEVTAEHEHWRRVRDSEGAEGWVYFRLLSALRTALIAPWDKARVTTPLLEGASAAAPPIAQLESGVKVYVQQCDGKWCRVAVSSLKGWIEQNRLWGVYPNEIIN